MKFYETIRFARSLFWLSKPVLNLTFKGTAQNSVSILANYLDRSRSIHHILLQNPSRGQHSESDTMTSHSSDKEIRLPQFAACNPADRSKSGAEFEARLNQSQGLHDVVSTCAKCLCSGGVIAVPTDTIYGVACLAQNTEAVKLLYEIKQRNYEKPVAISLARIDDIYRWGKVTVDRQVLEDLLPGPVTVVFERSPELNDALNPQTSLVGIRIPGHKFMQELAKECDGPVALTSANISGASSCLQVEEFSSLWPRLDLIVNGGTLSDSEEARLGSTVVDLSVPGTFYIIRPGSAYESTCLCLKEKHGLQERSNR